MAQPAKKSKREMMARLREKTRADPVAHAAYKQKEKERYQQRKAAGKINNINQKSDRAKRAQRNEWRNNKRRYRRENNEPGPDTEEREQENMPPTPESTPQRQVLPQGAPERPLSHQKKAGRRKMRRDERKVYREVNKLKERILNLNKEIRKLQRKNRQLKTRNVGAGESTLELAVAPSDHDSPLTKAKKIMKKPTNVVQRQLTFGFCIANKMKETMTSAKSTKRRRLLQNAVAGKMLRKYKFLAEAKRQLKASRQGLRVSADASNATIWSEQQIVSRPPTKVVGLAVEFYYRDDVSRQAAGKKETKTKNGEKRIRRYLLDTRLNLHRRFLSEYSSERISYSLFCRIKPFHITEPKVSDRDTTACKIHCNFQYYFDSLKRAGAIINTSISMGELCVSLVCTTESFKCANGDCDECRDHRYDQTKFLSQPSPNPTTLVTFSEFVQKKVKKTNARGKAYECRVWEKVTVTSTLDVLVRKFQASLLVMIPHQFRIYHQYAEIRGLKLALKDEEAVLQIDFSENYEAKLALEIQSMHYGASKMQMTLHTCHATLKKGVICFCTVSSDLRHTAPAVWAHLEPVLSDLASQNVKILHIISDGPSSQYKNRFNFKLLQKYGFQFGFTEIVWNFLESSHGKGPADGVGATVKSAADRHVAHGGDIKNVEDMMAALKPLNIKMMVVDPERIDHISRDLTPTIPIIENISKLHQLICQPGSGIVVRPISCYCREPECYSTCYGPRTVSIAGTSSENESEESDDGDGDGSLTDDYTAEKTTIQRLEVTLTHRQKILFERRWEEGYANFHIERADLSPEDLDDYCKFTVWKQLKLAEAELSSQRSSDSATCIPAVGQYHSVLFTKGRKKLFYIGRVISNESENLKLKYLERVGSRDAYCFDWPARDDISAEGEDLGFFLTKLDFFGPPPFILSKFQVEEIMKHDLMQ